MDRNVHVDWDKTADILYVVREGYDLDQLINVDSRRIAGIVKRLDPETKECVGFIIHGFARLYPAYTHMKHDQLCAALDLSMKLSSDCAHLTAY